jgi:hypothetical protein
MYLLYGLLLYRFVHVFWSWSWLHQFLWNLEYGNVVKGLNSNDKIDYSVDIHAIYDPIVCFVFLRWVMFVIFRSPVIEKSSIYHKELEIKETTETAFSSSFLDIQIFFNFLFTYLFSITFLYCLLSFYFIKHVYIHTIEW